MTYRDDERATKCPDCEVDLLVDWEQSELCKIPQVLVSVCPQCDFADTSMAPTEGDGDGVFWYASMGGFRLCKARSAVVYPLSADEQNLECGSCGHMTFEVDANEEPDDGDPLVGLL